MPEHSHRDRYNADADLAKCVGEGSLGRHGHDRIPIGRSHSGHDVDETVLGAAQEVGGGCKEEHPTVSLGEGPTVGGELRTPHDFDPIGPNASCRAIELSRN